MFKSTLRFGLVVPRQSAFGGNLALTRPQYLPIGIRTRWLSSEAGSDQTKAAKLKQPRDYLKPFLLKVHPDLLPDKHRSINEKSLATLNSLLEKNKHTKRPLVENEKNIVLEFYLKPQAEDQPPKYITADLQLPSLSAGHDATPFVDRALARLLILSGITIPPRELASWERVWAQTDRGTGLDELDKNADILGETLASFNMSDISGLNKRPHDTDQINKDLLEHTKSTIYRDEYDPYDEPRFSLIATMEEENMIKYDSDLEEWEVCVCLSLSLCVLFLLLILYHYSSINQ